MVVNLESVKKNKEIYNKYVEKVIQQRAELMKNVSEIRRKKLTLNNEIGIARLDFEEANLIQQISALTCSLKNNKLTLKTLKLQEEVLQGKIDKISYSKGVISTRKERENLSKEDVLSYSENEVSKCEKALKLYTLLGDKDNIIKWRQSLTKARQELQYAREDIEIKEQKDLSQTESKNPNNVDINIATENDRKKTTRSLNGVEISSTTEYTNGSYDKKSRVIIEEGQEDELGRKISLSPNYGNFTAHQSSHNTTSGIYTEKWLNPIMDNNGKVIGQRKAIETTNQEGIRNINVHQNMENDQGIFNIETLINGQGETYSEQRNMTVNNKLSGNIENIQYIKDEQGNETYTYMENGQIGQKVKKTSRGTTIDIFKNGEPYATYEYDETGKAIIPMGKMEQLPEGYVENCFNIVIPENEIIPHKEPDEIYIQKEQESNENVTSQEQQSKSATWKKTMEFKIPIEQQRNVVNRHERNERKWRQNPQSKEMSSTENEVA